MVLRAGFLWLSERGRLNRFAQRNPLARRFASRFVAGETLDEVMVAAKELQQHGITMSLDLLGESVFQKPESCAARDQYLTMLDTVAAHGLDTNVSVKLTQLGLAFDTELCVDNMCAILTKAKQLNAFVRIDMESSAYTDVTLRLFYDELRPQFDSHVGVVIQACLRRSAQDIEELIRLGVRVRLVKGAYKEPPSMAFPRKADVDRNYIRLLEQLLEKGNYPAVATHDEKMITHACRFGAQNSISTDRYEFQMIYGVRRDLQRSLRKDGYNMRVYIPYGTQWYPYFMRRLAERPANVGFLLGSVLKELLRRR